MSRYKTLPNGVHPDKINECEIDYTDGVCQTLSIICEELFPGRQKDLEELLHKLPIGKMLMISAGAAMLIILIEAWFDDLIELL